MRQLALHLYCFLPLHCALFGLFFLLFSASFIYRAKVGLPHWLGTALGRCSALVLVQRWHHTWLRFLHFLGPWRIAWENISFIGDNIRGGRIIWDSCSMCCFNLACWCWNIYRQIRPWRFFIGSVFEIGCYVLALSWCVRSMVIQIWRTTVQSFVILMLGTENFGRVVPFAHHLREQIIHAFPVLVIPCWHPIKVKHKLWLRKLEPEMIHCCVVLYTA